MVEVYRLAEGAFTLSLPVTGDEDLSAEPLADLVIPLASLWT